MSILISAAKVQNKSNVGLFSYLKKVKILLSSRHIALPLRPFNDFNFTFL